MQRDTPMKKLLVMSINEETFSPYIQLKWMFMKKRDKQEKREEE